MEHCPYCNTEIVNELNFCVECEKQVKCLTCGSLLYKNKSRCLKCGKFLEGNTEASNAITNSYVLEEKSTKDSTFRRIEVKASDNAVDAFASKLPFGSANFLHTNTTDGDTITNANNNLLPHSLDNNKDVLDSVPLSENSNKVPELDLKNQSDSLNLLFSEHSEFILTPNRTLRDHITTLSTKKERQQVFIMLYAWHFYHVKNRGVSSNELFAVMKHENLFDTNTGRYIDELVKDYFVVNGSEYRVNEYDGRSRVDEILDDIKKPKSTQSLKETQKSKKGGRPSGSHNKKETEVIQPWLKLPLDSLNNFDIRRLSTATDWGLFSIYLITKELKVQDTVEPGIAYGFVVQKYSTLSISRKNFRDTVGKDSKNFLKSVNGAYSLTQTGEQKIKALIQGS